MSNILYLKIYLHIYLFILPSRCFKVKIGLENNMRGPAKRITALICVLISAL